MVRLDDLHRGSLGPIGGCRAPRDELAQSFLEDLLNAVSHGDLPITRTQVDEGLGPISTERAHYFDRVWVAMPNDVATEVMESGTFESIRDDELRWLVRCSFRRTPNGSYVGISDIVRRETRTGLPGASATRSTIPERRIASVLRRSKWASSSCYLSSIPFDGPASIRHAEMKCVIGQAPACRKGAVIERHIEVGGLPQTSGEHVD